MRILIGTPIHQIKDYAMEQWLANVAKLQKVYPADLLLVDNSPGLDYVEKVKRYCSKFKIRNYKIKHLEIPQGQEIDKGIDEQIHERIVRCEEIIRTEFLASSYDAWFFWESDILIPVNALRKLAGLMKLDGLSVVIHNCWVNNVPNKVNFHFGVTLFNRDILEKYSFIPAFGTDPDAPPSWYEAEQWFRDRLRKDNCNFIEIQGLIEPIYHLAE